MENGVGSNGSLFGGFPKQRLECGIKFINRRLNTLAEYIRVFFRLTANDDIPKLFETEQLGRHLRL